jgi:hypothetical protein
MNVDQFVKAIEICHRADVALQAWGPRGLGKSTAPKAYCSGNFHFYDENGLGYVPYGIHDFRAAQMESSEVRGIPKDDAENNRFIYLPPPDLPQEEFVDEYANKWGKPGDEMPEVSPFYKKAMKRAKDSDEAHNSGTARQEEEAAKWPFKGKVALHQGILFLDEPNRGEDHVINAFFQLILDRCTGGYTMPTGWGIVLAANPSGTKYRVNTMVTDAAWVSRMCHVGIERTDEYVNGWLNYMNKLPAQIGADSDSISKITQFCASNLDHLVPNESSMEDIQIEPNPRSWEFVARIESSFIQHGGTIFDDDTEMKNIRRELLSGCVGMSVANAYMEWSTDIYPKDIINGEFTKDLKKKLKKLTRSELQGLTWGVSNYATSIDPTEHQIDNGKEFARWLIDEGDKDLAVAYAKSLTSKELTSALKGVALVNPSIQRIMKKNGKMGDRKWYSAIVDDKKLAESIQITAWGEKIG